MVGAYTLRLLSILGVLVAMLLGVACAPAPAAPAAKPAEKAAAPPPAPAAKPAEKPAAPAPEQKPAAPAAPAKAGELSMGTGGTAGTYYPFGGAMAKIWAETDPSLKVTIQATGGSVENIRLLGRKQLDLALAQNDISDYAYNGTEMFAAGKVDIRGIATMYPEYVQMVVSAESGIKQVADLKGKRFSPGPPGSGTEVNSRQIIETAGLKKEDLAAYQLLSIAEATAAFKDRRLDGFSITIGVPAPAIQDVAMLQSIRLLPIGGKLRDDLRAKYKFYTPVTVPKGTYRGQDEDVPTVAVMAMLIARPDLPEDTVYRLTKTLVEKQSALAQAHAKGKDFNPKDPVAGMSIPLHPGAEKYYREVGIKK